MKVVQGWQDLQTGAVLHIVAHVADGCLTDEERTVVLRLTGGKEVLMDRENLIGVQLLQLAPRPAKQGNLVRHETWDVDCVRAYVAWYAQQVWLIDTPKSGTAEGYGCVDRITAGWTHADGAPVEEWL